MGQHLFKFASPVNRSIPLTSSGNNLRGQGSNSGSRNHWRSFRDWQIFLWLHDGYVVRKGSFGTILVVGVPGQHDLDLDAKHTLTEEHMPDSTVNIDIGGLSTVDHETINKFHALGTLTSQLSRDHHFATLGA